MEPTVRDVLAFHGVDRAAYERLLSLGAGREPARDAVALLMWLHRVTGVDAVDGLRSAVRTPAAAAWLLSETRAVLLHGGCGGDGVSGSGAPLISSLCCCSGGGGAVDVRLFLDLLPDNAPRRGVAGVLDGVGALVFDDRLHALLRRHEEVGGAVPPELATPYRRGAGAPAPADEDGRSLFITFSKGFPLTREEILEYFTEKWGDGCVDRVMMEKTARPEKEPPTYGRVVCRSAAVVAAVLGGRRLARLLVNGRHLWARKFVPKKLQQR